MKPSDAYPSHLPDGVGDGNERANHDHDTVLEKPFQHPHDDYVNLKYVEWIQCLEMNDGGGGGNGLKIGKRGETIKFRAGKPEDEPRQRSAATRKLRRSAFCFARTFSE